MTDSATGSDWLRLLRPAQWAKNAFVVAPLIFSGRAREAAAVTASLQTLVAFCLLASGVYVLNDIVDREQDRAHPVKRTRPIASGQIAVGSAAVVGVLLLAGGLAIGWLVGPAVVKLLAVYVVLNVLYTLIVKRVVILDVFTVAAFFILRLLVGAAAVDVHASVWLLLCGGLLALFLGFAKRRHELVLLGDTSREHRSVLAEYSAPLLDQISVVLLSVTIVAYIMYTLESATAAQVQGEALTYSVPFVLFGVFRYLYLVHRRDLGSPTETLFGDPSLVLGVIGWLGYCGWVLYRPH